MKIENIRIETLDERSRVVARISWEDCDQPVREIFFETNEAYASALACLPDAFLAGAIVPAFWAGEKRIQVEGEVCPELSGNLEVALLALQHWFKPDRAVTQIEGKARSQPCANGSRRAACFLSGGIDSLSSLRANRLTYPPEHPGSIKDGLLIFGLEVESTESFRHVHQQLSALAKDAGINLIPIATNLRSLNDDWGFWYDAWMGGGVCAAAHALSRRLAVVTIASDYHVPDLRPHGSHPLMEPNFSSYEVRIRYDGISRSRLAKTKLLAEWNAALQNLRVCNREQFYRSGQVNCGECEKCVRTMLELLVLGALKKTKAFGRTDVSSDLVIAKAQLGAATIPYYVELLGPLAQIGRHDLVKAVRYVLQRVDGEIAWKGFRTVWFKGLKRFDRKFLFGAGLKLKRSLVDYRLASFKRS